MQVTEIETAYYLDANAINSTTYFDSNPGHNSNINVSKDLPTFMMFPSSVPYIC